MKKIWIVLLVCAVLCTTAMAENTLYVKPVENLPADFIMGMDVSSVTALENSGVRYYDADGQETDLFEQLAAAGVNYIRVRLWNDPWDEEGHGYGGGNCDLDNAIAIGRRATEHGMRVLVDFHYSDFWADPAKQQPPKAWAGMSFDEKKQALYDFTYDSLTALREAGVDVGMVQLGNETNGKLCGEKIWMKIYYLMDAGSRAVRAVDPQIRIAVHFANPESGDQIMTFASKLAYYDLDYDVFGVSYYPYWHGTLENLAQVLTNVQTTYGKQVTVAENSYAYTEADSDFSGNTIGEGGGYEKYYPFTVQGQANEVRDLVDTVNQVGGIGVFYWEGAWITVGGSTWEENSALWETYGSGWASSYAGSYDPKDAGVYYGGSACDNQAMFDAQGKALPSLQIFRLCRAGQLTEVKPDALQEVYLTVDLSRPVELPQTVSAVMNDGSLQDVPVIWAEMDPAMLAAEDEVSFTVEGVADGMPAVCHVSRVRFNYVADPSFEDADDSVWVATNLGSTEQLYVEEKKSDSLTGVKHYHFYSQAANSVEFTLEQTVAVPAGVYDYAIAVQGGDAGDQTVYSYVKINGETVATADAVITSWNKWDTPVINGISVAEGDTVTVGIYVRCAGAGAWGKIDDARLTVSR